MFLVNRKDNYFGQITFKSKAPDKIAMQFHSNKSNISYQFCWLIVVASVQKYLNMKFNTRLKN